ncbi:zinc-dependent metalloprotease [Schaalia sp. ZJ405]|uniref:zinc-dependent metalloprotease n=1 Tax=Schaalia sp. ZJ405 TaxID=2709403 RepID=UPI0013EDED67|nr:zinc-dependent metalloprotease [Schaalia sp. ZJ405]QPK80751.1 zinc-dependent metalloprotease [Schaalia sp. ZJ405]
MEANDPFSEFLRRMLGDEAAEEAAHALQAQGFDPSTFPAEFSDPQKFTQAVSQFEFLMNSSSGPVNWRIVEDTARQQAFQSGDPSPTAAQAQRARQAMSVADLWLDSVTEFSPGAVERHVWSRNEWIASTLDMWKRICEPVAASVSRALGAAMSSQLSDLGIDTSSSPLTGNEDEAGILHEDEGPLSDGLRKMLSQTQSMIPQLSAVMFGAQIGNALAALSKDSLGSFDVGLPLVDKPVTALVVHNIEEFSDGVDIPFEEIQQFVAVREAAHRRLFTSVPWLARDLIHAVERYSGEIAIDMTAITDAAQGIDLSDPQSFEGALAGGIFEMNVSPTQAATLERLETLLALVEGWVEVVTAAAVAPYLPHADQLRELVRRRRATGAPAEDILGQLIGLRMRPRRARGAASIFSLVQADGGAEAREALWSHPDVIPTATELDTPDTFLTLRRAAKDQDADIDAALNSLLDGTMGWASGLSPEDDPERETLKRAGFSAGAGTSGAEGEAAAGSDSEKSETAWDESGDNDGSEE